MVPGGAHDDREDFGDAKSFDDLANAFRAVGFHEEEVNGCFAVVASLLHASNLSFVSSSDSDCEVNAKNASLRGFQFLLHVDRDDVNPSFCNSGATVYDSEPKKRVNKNDAMKRVEMFIRSTYAALVRS